jgi:hypothetical protein
MMLHSLPVLGKASRGRLTYRASPALRLFFLAAALGSCAVAWTWPDDDAMTRLLFYSAALILFLSALTEDRWTFLAPPLGLKRRFGVLPFVRKWDMPSDRLYSISLRSGEPGEAPSGVGGDREKLEASIHGMNRHPWVALVLGLSDGKSLVLAAGRRRLHERLRKDGLAIAAQLCLEFEDKCINDSPRPDHHGADRPEAPQTPS